MVSGVNHTQKHHLSGKLPGSRQYNILKEFFSHRTKKSPGLLYFIPIPEIRKMAGLVHKNGLQLPR